MIYFKVMPKLLKIHTSIVTYVNPMFVAEADLSIRGSTKYFYPPKMVFGTS